MGSGHKFLLQMAGNLEEYVEEVEEYMSKEVVAGAEAHIKMELTYQMSPVNLRIQSGPHSQMIQGKGSLGTQ